MQTVNQTSKESTSKRKKKLDEISLDSQPIRLRLMTRNDKIAYVNCKTVKKISKKNSIFASLLLEMCQILQALHGADHFAQTMKSRALEARLLALQRERKEKILMLVKSDKFERTMMWHIEDELLCYKQK